MQVPSSSPHPLSRHPASWYALALSSDLAPGGVQAARACGREIALFRTATGQAVALDAHCSHVGAPLFQGTIEGEWIRCPFHRWAYGADGACREIPYSGHIPARARVRSYPVVERNGVVLAWIAGDDRPPSFDVPELAPESWSPILWAHLVFPVHIQEVAENGVDVAHFLPVHCCRRASAEVVDASGVPFHFLLRTSYDGDGIGVPGVFVDVTTEWHYYGMGVFCGISTADAFGTRVRHLFHFTPLPGDLLQFRIGIAVDLATVPAEMVDWVQQKNAEMSIRNLEQDAPIWAEKAYLSHAVFCEGDGPYGALRRWSRQFYP